MTDPQGRINDESMTRARAEVSISEARRDGDEARLAQADRVLNALRTTREANHWADKIGQLFRGTAA